MKLVIVSGLSGSGKTIALHTLEDEGFHCVDNLPLALLAAFVEQLVAGDRIYEQAAVGIDARGGADELEQFPRTLEQIRAAGVDVEILFLQASEDTLLNRFSETRRKHPLTQRGLPLLEALHVERSMLSGISNCADLTIDTSATNLHQLRSLVRQRVSNSSNRGMLVLFQSFGFKQGVPADSDFVFDVRCLPNPYWDSSLRALSGKDQPVARFLAAHPEVTEMYESIAGFLQRWIPRLSEDNRRYLGVSIGCTGGKHRSVYLVERLAARFRSGSFGSISVLHRDIDLE